MMAASVSVGIVSFSVRGLETPSEWTNDRDVSVNRLSLVPKPVHGWRALWQWPNVFYTTLWYECNKIIALRALVNVCPQDPEQCRPMYEPAVDWWQASPSMTDAQLLIVPGECPQPA